MPSNNAIVNTTPTTSETPSNLVRKGKSTPKKVAVNIVDTATNTTETKPLGEVHGELSPNPAGFGFTKQVKVDALVSPGSPDTLYLLAQYDGEGHVKEYYKYRWNVAAFAYERIFEPVNNVKFEDGEHATPVHENVPPKQAPEKIFNGDVVFGGNVYFEGDAVLKGKNIVRPLCSFEVDNIKAIPGEIIDQLKCGDVVVKRTVEDGKVLHHAYIVTHRQATGICLSYNTTGYSETQSYDYIGGQWVYNSEDKWVAE